MRIRSPRLLALSLVLLAAGGALGALLELDGASWDHDAFLAAHPGDEVVLQAAVEGLTRADWALIGAAHPILNHTYTADRGHGWWAVATSDSPIPVDGSVVLHGVVVHESFLDDGTAFILLRVERVAEPLFG